MTSSERPGGTVSDSISVTKPYLYGWRTWVSIPLLIGAPEVLCASQVAEIWPWRRRILQELLGIVNQAPGCALVDVPIHLPDEALVILRRREIGVLDDDALVGGEGGSDARRVGSEHHDPGLHVQRLQRLEDADDEGPTSEVQECLGPTHSLRGPGSQDHPRETHAITLSRVAPRRQTPKLAAHGRTTHFPPCSFASPGRTRSR